MEQILKSRYRIAGKMSESPFSITYRGFLIGTEKPVVIKIYKRGTLSSLLIKGMKQKVKDFSLITHHGIAKLLDGDYGWQGFYYVRECIEGQSLQDLLSRAEKIGVEMSVDIIDQVLDALEVVHKKGIVHGALKPTNIFIDDQGLVRLTDFVIEGQVKESMPYKVEEIMCNAKYASPEELEGKALTPASDIFSLGLIFYELATGKPVLGEAGAGGNIKKLKNAPLLQKEDLASLPRFLGEIISKALNRDPLLRFSSAAQLRESMEKKSIVQKPTICEDYMQIFENVVTQYGGEELDRGDEAPQEIGKIRWSKEKHRNWILAVAVASAVVLGIIYAFFSGR